MVDKLSTHQEAEEVNGNIRDAYVFGMFMLATKFSNLIHTHEGIFETRIMFVIQLNGVGYDAAGVQQIIVDYFYALR